MVAWMFPESSSDEAIPVFFMDETAEIGRKM
jgi:hypothetical protein